MKQTLLRFLARRPSLYLHALRLLGRGSLEKKIFLSLIRDGDVVFDIGANRGQFTRLFSDLAGKKGAVHAFEPVPATFAMLFATMNNWGGFKNFTLNNFALGDMEGTIEMHLPANDDGQASMRMHDSGSWRDPATIQSHQCPVSTLDTHAAGFSRLDFIKCDVEGAELLVANGGPETLRRLSSLLFMEANPEWTKAFDYTPGDLVLKLREYGYDTFFLAGEKLVPLEGGEFTEAANLLCAKAQLHKERLAGLENICA